MRFELSGLFAHFVCIIRNNGQLSKQLFKITESQLHSNMSDAAAFVLTHQPAALFAYTDERSIDVEGGWLWCWAEGMDLVPIVGMGSHVLLHLLHPTHLSPAGQLY